MPNSEELHSKLYWKWVIFEIELAAYVRSRKQTIKNCDFSVALPENLRDRVAKILPYDYYDFDRNVFNDDFEDAVPISMDENESEDSEVERKRLEKKRKVFFNLRNSIYLVYSFCSFRKPSMKALARKLSVWKTSMINLK